MRATSINQNNQPRADDSATARIEQDDCSPPSERAGPSTALKRRNADGFATRKGAEGPELDALRRALKSGVPSDPKSKAAETVVDAAQKVCSGSCGTCPFSAANGFGSQCEAVKALADRMGRIGEDGTLKNGAKSSRDTATTAFQQGARDIVGAASSCAGSCGGCSCAKDDLKF
ncbi:MAG: hypothetical protein AAF735_03815 [Myxococcota bacterium]